MSESMFTGNLLINGGTFNQSIARTQLSISFDKLAGKASPRAFHFADSDLAHSTCFTNTRTKILERMKGWALRNTEKDKFVMWLHGAAGGGKTAIGRTMAKWCDEEEGILLGEFFFSRADGTGDQLASLAPTLAYRMAVHTLKDAKEAISDVVSRDPHIFLASLADQLKKLVLEPYDLLAPCGITPYVIILDGLDETLSPDDQQLVLDVISETFYHHNLTLRILICSRPEPTIVTAFNDPDSLLNAISTNISLNNDVDSDTDIRRFLVEKFARIKKQLPYPPSGDWPPPANIDYLVAKSSGQFIFAATVEKYVCSPKHRHQAVARLKHVLDLELLPHLKDKEKHPFADLDTLYALILRTRNDVDISVKAIAVCLEYPKYFSAISPANLAHVLHVDLSETWAILYELASLLDANEDNIRPFHASFGDFLFDRSRSLDFYCTGGDIVADITYAMLRPRRDPEGTRHLFFLVLVVNLIETLLELSYHTFSRLLGEATPRQDLRDLLNQMTPASILRRPSDQRPSKGAYYLIPLLRQLESHVSPDVYKNLVAYFDQNYALLLPSGRWSRVIFCEDSKDGIGSDRNKGNNDKGNNGKDNNDKGDRKMLRIKDESESDDSMISLQSVSNTSDDDYDDSDDSEDSDDDERIRRRQALKARGPELASYHVSQLAPLSTSPAWDEINAHLNIHLTGSDSLQGLCDEAYFARSHLPKTSSALHDDSTQAQAALFCLEQITDGNITEDMRIAFAKLLPHSLFLAQQLPALTTVIQTLLTQHPTLYKGLPLVTMGAITDYLGRLPSSSGSQKPKTAARAVPKASPAPQRTPGTVPNSSTNATTGQKPSTAPTSSTAHRTAQKSTPPSQPPSTTNSKRRTPSQPQPVPRTFLAPSSSRQTQPSPSTSQKTPIASRAPQKAPTPSRPPPSPNSKISTPSQPLPASHTSQSSARTQPSPSAPQKPLSVSRTPEQPDSSQPATIPDSKSSTTRGPSTTTGVTLEPSHPSKSLPDAQAPSGSSHPQSRGPSRRGKKGKGRGK